MIFLDCAIHNRKLALVFRQLAKSYPAHAGRHETVAKIHFARAHELIRAERKLRKTHAHAA